MGCREGVRVADATTSSARAAGLDAVWVERLERRWPLPLPEPRTAAFLLEAVEMVLSASSR